MPTSPIFLRALILGACSLAFAAAMASVTVLLIRHSRQQHKQAGYRTRREFSLVSALICVSFLIESLAMFRHTIVQDGLWLIRAVALLGACVFVYRLIPIGRQLAALPARSVLEKKNRQLMADIERIRHTNEVIALSEARYRLLMDTAAEGIWILDRVGRISLVNPRLADMMGMPADQIKGRALLEMVPEAERPDIINLLQRQQRGEAARTLCHLLRPDGELIAVQISSTPITRDGTAGSSLSVITDLSDQMKIQDQLRRVAADLQEQVQGRTLAYRDTAARLAAMLETSRNQSRAYSILQDLNDMLQTCSTPYEAARVAGEFAIKLFHADSGSLYTVEPGQSTFHILGSWGLQNETADTLNLNDCWGLRQNQAYPHSDNQIGIRCRHLSIGPNRHSCCMPMFANGQATGLICLRSDQPFIGANTEHSAANQKIRRLFASSVAQFMANLTLRQTLEQASLRDPLTNLFNRRYFNEQLLIEFERASRARSPLAIQMVDIDHFKRLNDRYGHEAGDRVLRQVADVLTQNARAGDIVCRWGGEEFLILMPGLNGTSAKRRADEIRRSVHEQVQTVNGSPVSISIGVAAYPEHASDPDGLINVSDRALYASKGAGRNRVTMAVSVL